LESIKYISFQAGLSQAEIGNLHQNTRRYIPIGHSWKLLIKRRDTAGYSTVRHKSALLRPAPSISRCFTECRIFRGRLLRRSAGGHYRLRALHTLDAASGRLFGDVGPTMASVGQIHQHDALCLSEHADSGVWRRRTDCVRLFLLFIVTSCHIVIVVKILSRATNC